MSSWNAVIPILIKIQLTVFWLDRQYGSGYFWGNQFTRKAM